MKKGLIFVLGILSFLGINSVSAKEIYLEYDTNINEIKPYIDEIGMDTINNKINLMLEYYNNELVQELPYYYVSFVINGFSNFAIQFTAFTKISDHWTNHFQNYSQSTFYTIPIDSPVTQYQYIYDNDTKTFSELDFSSAGYSPTSIIELTSESNGNKKKYNPYKYYYSNFDLFYNGEFLEGNTFSQLTSEDTLYIPTYEDSSKYISYKATSKILISPYYLYDNNSALEDNKYITIDLNQYSYVILSLKNYSISEAFSSVLYLKGQVCITPVYNYGSEEKKDYISGWQSPPCTGYLEEYTSNYLTISKEDITNHAVYYLTGYDSSKSNLVMVKNSIFDITYITSENESNPNIIINGKNYTLLPYSSLTDTAELTEKNGIKGTFSCAKYDTDCFMDSSGIDIDNLFSSPLETLETIWDVITSTFKLVTEFISLLPETLQAFLYLAFGVGIALGIIKIIL